VRREAKALPEGFLAGPAVLAMGGDALAGEGVAAASEAALQGLASGGPGLAGFAAASYGSLRYETGSHVDVKGYNIVAGLSFARAIGSSTVTFGAFAEYGKGDFDTHNSFPGSADVNGDGDTEYVGGGILVRADLGDTGTGHPYVELSARAGQVRTEYSSRDLVSLSGVVASYNSRAPYYGVHLGAGYIWDLTGSFKLDAYAKWLWTRQGGDSVRLSTGETVDFEDVDSSRVRLGARVTWKANEHASLFAGAAWERELDGVARARTNGFPFEAPSLKGSTGIGELGVALKPSEGSPLSVELSVAGYTGRRQGVTGSLMVSFEF
jgi:outer membrane autotransporter protein